MADSENLKRLKVFTSEDRISSLPDSILSHILSFLPTKYAVRTHILSTRWKFLWTYITNLDFDDGSFLHYEVIKETDREHKLFMLFIYRVLLLLKPLHTRKYRLKCRCVGSNGDLHINGWVSTAIERGVEELDLKISGLYLWEIPKNPLPRTLFNCKTLAVLKLDGPFNLDLSTASVSLPSLKILHLLYVTYEDEEYVHNLFRSCLVLEDLVIERVHMDEAITFNISSALLIRLKLIFDYDGENRYILQINAPALEYLDLKDHRSWQVSLTNMVSLVEANVDAYIENRPENRYYDDDDDDKPNYDHILFKLLEGLSNAKFLSLSRYTMKALSFASQLAPPKFHNLIRLKVSFKNRSCEWKPLSSLVANAVNLEEIICK